MLQEHVYCGHLSYKVARIGQAVQDVKEECVKWQEQISQIGESGLWALDDFSEDPACNETMIFCVIWEWGDVKKIKTLISEEMHVVLKIYVKR